MRTKVTMSDDMGVSEFPNTMPVVTPDGELLITIGEGDIATTYERDEWVKMECENDDAS